MPKTHVVKQGDYLSGIAFKHGFGDWHIVWNHPGNAEIKRLRDPHILFPGDRIVIPDRTVKAVSLPTARVHFFKIVIPALFLRLKIHDVDDKPVPGARCELGIESDAPAEKKTDEKGFVEHEIEKLVKNAEAVVHKKLKAAKKGDPETFDRMKFDIKIGHLNPKDKLSGQQARLNNLGYFAGFSPDDLEQFRWAIEEFQCDHMKNGERVTVKPSIEPESAEPAKKTGVQDPDTQNKLEKVHGC